MADSNRDTRNVNRLEEAVRSDPRIEALLAKLSPQEAERLGRVIADPVETKRLLSSPQAQRIMEALRKGHKQQ